MGAWRGGRAGVVSVCVCVCVCGVGGGERGRASLVQSPITQFQQTHNRGLPTTQFRQTTTTTVRQDHCNLVQNRRIIIQAAEPSTELTYFVFPPGNDREEIIIYLATAPRHSSGPARSHHLSVKSANKSVCTLTTSC